MTIEAIKDLFDDLLNFEKDVLTIYKNLIDQLSDEEAKNIISGIIADEERHVRNAEEILSILDA